MNLAFPHHRAPLTLGVSARLWFTIAKHGDRTPLTCNGSVPVTTPWSTGSVAPKTNETLPVSLLRKIGIEDIMTVLHSRRFSWYGHGHNAMFFMKFVSDTAIPGTRRRGRSRKNIWSECVKNGVRESDLPGIDPQDRDAWRAGVCCSLVLPNSTIISILIWMDRWMDGLMDGLNPNTRVSWTFLGRMSEWPRVDTWQNEDQSDGRLVKSDARVNAVSYITCFCTRS